MALGTGFNDDFFQFALNRATSPIGEFLMSATPQTGHVELGGAAPTGSFSMGAAPAVGHVDLGASGYAAPSPGVDFGPNDFLRPLQLIQQGLAKAGLNVAAANQAQQQQQAPPKPGQPAAPAKPVTGGVIPSQGLEGISLAGLGPQQRQEFLNRAMALGQVLEQETGIPAEVFAAMAANESNFGNAPGNIMGGVKAARDDPNAIWLDTWEMENGQRVQRREPFVFSNTALEGMRRVANTLNQGRYAQAYQQLREGQISPENFIFNVNRLGYATNPNWATNEIIPLMTEAAQHRDAGSALLSAVQSDAAARDQAVSATVNPGNQSLIDAAKGWTGTPYRLGGNGQGGIDCSALILRAAEAIGKPLSGVRTAQQIHNVTTPVDPSQVQPGDLVFFTGTYAGNPGEVDTHVGIVTGANTMISASSGGVGTQDFSQPYWSSKITGFTRLP